MLENEMQFRMDLEKLKAQVAELDRRIEAQDDGAEPPMRVEAGNGIDVQEVGGAYRVNAKGEPEALLPFDVRVNQADGAPGTVEFWLPADSIGAVVMRNGQRVVAESTKSYVYGAWNSIGTQPDESQYAVVLEIVEDSTYTQGSSVVTTWPVGHISATAWQIVLVKLSDIQSRYGSVAKTQMIIALVNASNNGITGALNVVQLMRGAVHTSFVSVDSDDELLFGRTGEAYWRSLSGIDVGGETAGQWKTRELRNFKKGTAPNFAPDSGEGTFAFVVRTQTTAGGTEVFYYDWSTFLTKLASKLKVTVGGTDYDVKVK
jgi:hypothetical protein